MKFYYYFFFLAISLLTASCQDFLAVKPDKQQAIPAEKLENLQLLLDNTGVMNSGYPSAGEIASDNFYIISEDWNALSEQISRNGYMWEEDVFNESDRNAWTLPYQVVFYSNLVLEGTKKIEPEDARTQIMWNNVRGSALFFRAQAFYQLLQIFAIPFDPSTANDNPGIVLRLVSDVNAKSTRATVLESYDQVVKDLQEALPLLPGNPAYKTRPSRPAALALLARTYLCMENYELALKYADECLAQYNTLLDYNELNTDSSNPVPRFNDEVIFHCNLTFRRALRYPVCKVDTLLYNSYASSDLRKNIFFRANAEDDIAFKGSYYGSSILFGGIATDEIYLIRSECYARKGELGKAMKDLNTLLENRHEDGSYAPRIANSQMEALNIILDERRKELVFRGLRWTDLRRLNKDQRFSKTLVRIIDDKKLTLSPNDAQYVFRLPFKVIESSGMEQN